MIPTILSGIFAIIACIQWWRTRQAAKEMQKLNTEFNVFREFYEWGGYTRIVVRDKLGHVDVCDMTMFALFLDFRNGKAFRNARLIHDDTEVKVYAQGKKEE